MRYYCVCTLVHRIRWLIKMSSLVTYLLFDCVYITLKKMIMLFCLSTGKKRVRYNMFLGNFVFFVVFFQNKPVCVRLLSSFTFFPYSSFQNYLLPWYPMSQIHLHTIWFNIFFFSYFHTKFNDTGECIEHWLVDKIYIQTKS